MPWYGYVVAALLLGFLTWLAGRKSRPDAISADRNKERKERLRNRIRDLKKRLLPLLLLFFLCGCSGGQVVLIPPGEPVQLAEDVEAYIYYEVEGELQKSETRVILPAGWWCLPDEEE